MSDIFAPVVCLVADDESVRKSLSRLLDSAGLTVQPFSNPKAFLEHVGAHFVSVVVLDIWMQSMTGMELLAHLCACSPQTRVIFITGHADHAAETTVMQAGAFAFFVKPLDDEKFICAVRQAFSHASPERNGSG